MQIDDETLDKFRLKLRSKVRYHVGGVCPDVEDLVASAHTLSSELTAKGFGSQLLAAMFRFDGYEHPVYFIYGFKRGAWWPFIPAGKAERDNAKELELKAKLEHELPIEQDLTRWLALFDAPV